MNKFENNILIYKKNNQIFVLYPCSHFRNIIEIGEKDIPEGIPFWIINNQDLPNTPQETWKLENMGEPSGYGKRK